MNQKYVTRDDEVSKNLHIRKMLISAIFGVLGISILPIQKEHLRALKMRGEPLSKARTFSYIDKFR